MSTESRLSPLFSWRSAVSSPYGPDQATTRHVLLTLSLHMNEKGGSCHPSVQRIVKESGLTKRTVLTHLEKANSAGWITKYEAGLSGQRHRRSAYAATIPESFWQGVAVGYEEGEHMAQEIIEQARMQMPAHLADTLPAGDDPDDDPDDDPEGGEGGSPPSEKGGERDSPYSPKGGEIDSPPSEKGGEPNAEGGESLAEGGEIDSPKDDKKDASKDDSKKKRKKESAREEKPTSADGPALPFLNKSQRSHLSALHDVLQDYEPEQALELVRAHWGWGEAAIEADAQEFRRIYSGLMANHADDPAAAWHRFACAIWLTGRHAQKPTVAYLERILENFDVHAQHQAQRAQRPDRQRAGADDDAMPEADPDAPKKSGWRDAIEEGQKKKAERASSPSEPQQSKEAA